MRNVFRTMANWFASGTEDFFTASLALFIERNEEFRDAFLDWVGAEIRDDLHQRHWTVLAQVPRQSCKGYAILDMVLRSPDLELWFEHKVGAPLGKYGEMDQLEKYLDAANRVMLGTDDGKEDVVWPEKQPERGRPRVILFYIARNPKPLDTSRYAGRVYEAEKRFGVVPKALGWRDLWPRADYALKEALRGEWGEFEKTLSIQFLKYWQSIPGMWKASLSNGDWAELLPDHMELEKGEQCGFGELWGDLVGYVQGELGGRCKPYLGYEQNCSLPEKTSADIEHIYVNAVPDVAKLLNWNDRLGPYVLRLTIRRRSDVAWPEPRPEVFDECWPIRLRTCRIGGAEQLEVLVGISGWDELTDKAARRKVVLQAFRAGLTTALRETGLHINSFDEA